MKTSDLLTVKKVIPTPLNVTSVTTSTSVSDILIPPLEAEESTPSSVVAEERTIQTEETVLAAADADEIIDPITPTPTATAKPTKKPTPAAQPTAKASVKPEKTEEPSPTSSPTATPVPTPSSTPDTSNSGGLSADKIFELVNNYRSSKGLPPVQKDERVCEVARSRAPEVGAEISGGYMHRGIRQRNLPYFNSEIIISMRTEEAAVQWWINDYIHRVQMEGDYKYSCAACSGNSCVQEFTNFVPKG